MQALAPQAGEPIQRAVLAIRAWMTVQQLAEPGFNAPLFYQEGATQVVFQRPARRYGHCSFPSLHKEFDR